LIRHSDFDMRLASPLAFALNELTA
jgi:hypothetical protein